MQDKFTPGPWKVERAQRQTDFDDTTVCFVNYGDGQPLFVSSASHTHGDTEATAKLIAAAPDLLKALEIELWAMENGEGESQIQGKIRLTERLEVIRAAIEKATL